jgi:poly(3-hydroxybutyrate) depolymerase
MNCRNRARSRAGWLLAAFALFASAGAPGEPGKITRGKLSSGDDGPLFLRDVVENVQEPYPVDDRRVYLFRHSAGTELALVMGTVESEYFAAVVIPVPAVDRP